MIEPTNDFPSHYRKIIDNMRLNYLALIDYIEALEEQCSVEQIEAARAAVRNKEAKP